MIDDILKDSEVRMEKSVATLRNELGKLRTGRAHPTLLDHLTVDYYGNETPLSQVASVTVSDARTLLITPWEKIMVGPIEKAIMNANLGLNPATAGEAIRVPMPALTEERRKDLVRVVRQEAESARVAVRNIRRDALAKFKACVKDKTLSEDDERRAQDRTQKLTDKYIGDVDSAVEGKEADLMAV